MMFHEINAKSILRRHKKVDSWFVTRYGMNFYRGCTHDCVYCDGRAEQYQVEGEFGKDVGVKTNAITVLQRELDPARKRIPFKRSFMLLGGGVGDAYQPAEKKYGLARRALELFYERGWPVHVLTKSTLVERDLPTLKKIRERHPVIVSFSFSSVDEAVSRDFEPGVPPPAERLALLSRLKREGLACGMFLMPVIPFLTDTPPQVDATVKAARDAGADFIIFGGMTLKEGRQKDNLFRLLNKKYSHLVSSYLQAYPPNRWGAPSREYNDMTHGVFLAAARRYGMPTRIPPRLFKNVLDENDRVVVMLEHLDYWLKSKGAPSPYGYAAYSVSQVKEPLSSIKSGLRNLKGVGPVTARIIREILDTGKSAYYDKLSLK